MTDFFLSERQSSLGVRPATPPRSPAYRRGGKRALDLALTLISVPVWFPLVALLWVVARQDGPGLYRQTRLGRNGTPFTCYKIRTMVPKADTLLPGLINADPALRLEWSRDQKLRHDPRITAFGRLLRASGLDELPQLFNVLRGDMSLVGPRPMLPEQAQSYRAAGGRSYFEMRPGLTGSWQVEARGQSEFLARVRFDEHYGKICGLRQDVALLVRTLGVLLRPNGS